jgi:tetratricopeptide (TPR) repeat protein
LDLSKSLEEAKAALAVDDVATAVRVATAAVQAGAQNSLLYNLAAHGLQLQRRFGEAMDLLNRALKLTPNDPLILNAIGHLLSQQGRAGEAVVAFQRALVHDHRLAPAQYGLGLAFEVLGETDRARAHFERAVQYAPTFADPLGSLAVLAVLRKADSEARAFAERALALDPFQSGAVLSLATLDFQAGFLDPAEERLRGLLAHGGLAPLHEASALKLLGDVLDARSDAPEAFKAYASGNSRLRAFHDSQPAAAAVEGGVDFARRLARYFAAAPAGPWAIAPPAPADAVVARHVFMIGFYRSGTTLLEQVLATHPEVRTMEERPALEEGAREFFGGDEGLDRLSSLTEERAGELRGDYWRRVRSYGLEPGGKVFVDKLPLGALWAPFIAKVFPEARLLFVRRDPRDVVLSCFRHRFQPNPLVHEFTDIDRAAMLYDAVMGLFEVCEQKLPLEVRVCRHEDLVQNFEGEIRGICEFLGIGWRDEMRDFAEAAKSREIRTPSAPQVVRGLYASGIGQWRAYAPAIPGALDILAPWVKKFGYPLS